MEVDGTLSGLSIEVWCNATKAQTMFVSTNVWRKMFAGITYAAGLSSPAEPMSTLVSVSVLVKVVRIVESSLVDFFRVKVVDGRGVQIYVRVQDLTHEKSSTTPFCPQLSAPLLIQLWRLRLCHSTPFIPIEEDACCKHAMRKHFHWLFPLTRLKNHVR